MCLRDRHTRKLFSFPYQIEKRVPLTAQVGAIPEPLTSEFVVVAVTVQEMEAIVKSLIVSRTGVMVVIDCVGMRPSML